MKKAQIIFFSLLLLVSTRASAGLLDFSGFYFADTFTNGTSSTYNRTFFDFCIATSLTKNLYVGWDYVSATAADNPGTAETLAGTQMGLKFFYFFGRGKTWRLAAAYNLVTSGSYTGASLSGATWKGTGIAADFGAALPMSENWQFTLRLNYLSYSFVDQFIGVAYEKVTVNRTFIYPSLGFSWDL